MCMFPKFSLYIHAYIYHVFFIYSSVNCMASSYFHNLNIVNSAEMNIGVQMSLVNPSLRSFGYMSRSSITGSYGSSIFSFVSKLHTALQNGCTYFHSLQNYMKFPLWAHPWHHLLLLLLLKMVILNWVRWILTVVLICICFIAREFKHIFMYLLVICSPFFENSLFNSCALFFTGMLIFWGLIFFLVSCRFWILVPYGMNSW
jgi:hypothetical protein